MEEKLNKETDRLIREVMQHVELASPSDEFNANVMAEIGKLKANKAIVYKPLISTRAWGLISFLIISLLTYSYFSSAFNSNLIFDFDQYGRIRIPNITLSSTVINSVIIIGVVILTQFVFLKSYFNKRIVG